MKTSVKLLTAALGTGLALGGCSAVNTSMDRAFSKLDVEAGHRINEGGFGNPTLNNQLAQTAYADQEGLLLDLNKKFQREVPTTINFAFNSAKLDEEAKSILDRQAAFIKQFPEIRFRVYGHTDLVGSTSYNQNLGLRRAQAAVRYLIRQGVNADNLEAMSSFGETRPVVATQQKERRNRRTVTEVVGFARNFVGTDLDGKYANLVYRTYANGGAAPTN